MFRPEKRCSKEPKMTNAQGNSRFCKERRSVGIVLTRRELRSMLDTAAINALTMVDDRIVEAMKSCGIGAASSKIDAAVSTAIDRIIDERLTHKRFEANVRDISENVAVEPHTTNKILDQLIQMDVLMISIP